jgi:hypothetical protein
MPELEPDEEGRAASGTRANRLVVAILVAIPIAAIVGLMVYSRRVRVIVDNCSPAPVTIALDGEPWVELARGQFVEAGAWRGRHRIEVTTGDRREEFTVDWVPRELGSGTFVLDPSALGAYELHDVVYGGPAPTTPTVMHVGERTFETGVVASVFVPPPPSLRLQHRETRTLRVLARVDDWSASELARFVLDKRGAAEAVAFLERATLRWPEQSEEILPLLSNLSSELGRHETFRKWLDERCREITPDTISAHRLRQVLDLAEGELDAVAKTYATASDDSTASYLRARIAASPETALASLDQLIARAPSFPWPYLDSGLELAARGDGDEGPKRVRRYLELRGRLGRHERPHLWRALAHAGRWGELESEIRAALRAGSSADDLYDLGHVLIARGTPDLEWSVWFRETSDRAPGAPWLVALALDRARWRADRERAMAVLRDHEVAAPHDARAIETSIHLGARDAKEAARALGEAFGAPRVARRAVHAALLVGIAAEWRGEDGTKFYERAEEAADLRAEHAICAFLLGKGPEEELIARERHQPDATRTLSLVARALRTRDATQRRALLDAAIRIGAWEVTDAAVFARGLEARER